MGVWNETCAISNLPILGDEPANIVFLARNPLARLDRQCAGSCYVHDQWTPYSLPLLGKYDSYGGISGIDLSDWKAQLLLEQLRADLVERKKGDTRREQAVRLSDLDDPNVFDLLVELIGDCCVQVREPFDKAEVDLGVCFIREDVRQALLKVRFKTWSGDWDLDKHVRDQMERRAHAHAMVDVLLTKARKEVENTPPMSAEEALAKFEELKRKTRLDQAGKLGSLYRGYRLFAAHAETESQMRDVAEFSHIAGCMEHLRTQWAPQAGKGSQGTYWETHIALAEAVLDIAKPRVEP